MVHLLVKCPVLFFNAMAGLGKVRNIKALGGKMGHSFTPLVVGHYDKTTNDGMQTI